MKNAAIIAVWLASLLLCPSPGQAMGRRAEAPPSPAVQSAVSEPQSQAKPVRAVEKDVPYVPTPRRVVAEMLVMAGAAPNDVLYDLGCGDGRIVIAALRDRHVKRAVGVDIDPERIRESRRNAAQAGVSDRAEFREEDLFKTDVSEATVVAMYLLPSINRRLRPRLLGQLKPGTRIVSHSFDMDDWKPDRAASLAGSSIYLWTVPANVSGDWSWTEPDGRSASLRLSQHFQEVRGVLMFGDHAESIREATLTGDRLRFLVDLRENGRSKSVRYEGRIDQDGLQGVTAVQDGALDLAQWQAARDPRTVAAIDIQWAAPVQSGTTPPTATEP